MIEREFPYTNLHDLNIDWILKIIKDFQERYQNLDETFQNMLQQIITAGNNAIEAINNNEETALEAIRVFEEQCIQAIDTETSGKITEIQNVTYNQIDAINAAGTNQIGLIDQDGAAKLSAISSAGAAQVNIINGLITSLPQTYEDSVNQLQIINAVLNQTYNYPPLVQGHYADAGESDSKTLVADNYRVSTLLSSGCASRKIKIQITGASGIIREILYWTGWGGSAVAHGVSVSTSASDEKTIFEYTFPATATYFTIVFCSDYNMLTQFLVSDLQVSFEWQFTALEGIELHEHGFDVSNTNALEFVIPGNTNLTIEEGSEIDEIDVSGGSKSVATSHKLKDSTARGNLNVMDNALHDFVCYEESSSSIQFEQGSFTNTGEESATDKVIRSYRYYNYRADRLYNIACANGYKMSLRAWDNNGTHLGVLFDDGVFRTTGVGTSAQISREQEYNLSKYPNYNIRILLYKYNGGSEMLEITPSDATNITFIYADVYGETFKRADRTAEIGATVYKPFNGTNEGKAISSSNWPRIARRAPYTTRGITSFVEVKAGTTVISYPGSGKTLLYYYYGTIDNASAGGTYPGTWSTIPISFTFDRDGVIIGRWANIDDTTPFNPDSFDGYMFVSARSAKDYIPLIGKRLSVIGDSISAYDGYSPSGALTYYPRENVQSWQQMYWGIIATEYSMILDTINAYAGTNVGTKWQTTERISFIEESRLSNLGTPDYIIVEGGTNDFGGNPLGEYPAWDTYTNLYEFRTAYAYLLNQLKIRYPAARIICLTIMANNGYNTVSGHYPEKQDEIKQELATDTTTHFLYEFNESIKELCKRYECYACDISDLMNYYNASSEAIGGVHPKAMTHRRIANRIAEVLKMFSYN